MLTLTTTQQAIVDSDFKKVDWLFKISDKNGQYYFWSTKDIPASYNVNWHSSVDWIAYNHWNISDRAAYEFRIIDFSGVEMYRNRAELGVIAANSLTFTVVNKDSQYNPKDFEGGMVRIALRVSDGTSMSVLRRWRFTIKKTEPEYQKFRCVCDDWLQNKLRGDYPNTRFIRDLWNLKDTPENDNVCEPIPFGEPYIPLRSVYISGTTPVTGTDISAVASTEGSRCLIKHSGRDSSFTIFRTGRYVTISGFTNAANNGIFRIVNATYNLIELSEDAGLVTEAAGNSVTLSQGSRYYVLGKPTKTYVVTEVRTPRACGRKSSWSADTTKYSEFASPIMYHDTVAFNSSKKFVQYSYLDDSRGDTWRVFEPLIADANNDGLNDSCGVWVQGSYLLDMPTKFYRSDTSSMTNPAEVLKFILSDMGVDNIDLDSFQDAHVTYDNWGLIWNGALWYKEPRKTILSRLLVMCHSNLVAGESVELYPLSAVPQKIITSAEIMKPADVGEGTFKYSDVRSDPADDCGYIAWQPSGEAQDAFIKTLVPVRNGVYTRISKEICQLPWVSDTQHAQKLGIFYFQRKLAQEAVVTFRAKGTCLALTPGDVVTISDESLTGKRPYGGGTLIKWTTGSGGELVTNGTFDSNINNWNNLGGSAYDTFEWVAGKLHAITNGAGIAALGTDDNIPFVKDKSYKIQFTVAVTSGVGPKVYIQDSLGGIDRVQFNGTNPHASGSYTYYFTSTLTENVVLTFWNLTQATEYTIDNVSIIEQTATVWQPAVPAGTYEKWNSLNYDVIIDSMRINKDLSIDFSCSKHSVALYDWDSFNPIAITPAEDDLTKMWQPAISGPLSDESMGLDLTVPFKTYLTVSPVENKGDYQNIQSAVNALKDTNATGIFLKSGDYKLTQSVYLPDKRDVEIVGESQTGVNIYSNSIDPVFRMMDCKKNYLFDTFTIRSTSDGSSHAGQGFIHLENTIITNASLIVRNVQFIANGSTENVIPVQIGGDVCIYAQGIVDSSETVLVEKCYARKGSVPGIVGARYFVQTERISDVKISKNYVYNGRRLACLRYSDTYNISSNTMTHIYDSVYIDTASGGGEISNNKFISLNCENASYYGITIYASNDSVIKGNTISGSSVSIRCGIFIFNSDNIVVTGNNIRLVSPDPSSALTTEYIGIILQQMDECIVSDNQINLNITSAPLPVYGIYLFDADYVILNGNQINLNSSGTETGIMIDVDSDYNRGTGNIVNLSDTIVNDAGGTSTVEANGTVY